MNVKPLPQSGAGHPTLPRYTAEREGGDDNRHTHFSYRLGVDDAHE